MQPIQQVNVTQEIIDDKVDYKLHLNKDAREILTKFADYKISPLCICGRYRGGKSFLANLLVDNELRGFKIGSTTQACTKGLWIWPEPIELTDSNGEKVQSFIQDCEGSSSSDRDKADVLDSKQTSQILLICSIFIWNGKKVIEESDIERQGAIMSLTTKLVEINAKEGISLKGSFPKFYWVLRDFFMDLGEDTPTSYLENSLMIRDTNKDSSRYQIRKFIKDNLPDRTCHTLRIPVNGEQQLKELDSTPYNKLRPEFREDFEALKTHIQKNVTPKTYLGKEQDIMSFFELTNNVCELLNQKNAPVLTNVADNMFKYKLDQIYNTISQDFQNDFQKMIEPILPLKSEEIHSKHFDIQNEFLGKYYNSAKSQLSCGSLKSEFERLLTGFNSYKLNFQEKNELLSVEKSNQLQNSYTQELDLPIYQNIEEFYTESEFAKYKEFFNSLIKTFLNDCKVSKAKDIGQNFFVNNIWDNLMAIIQKIKSFYDHKSAIKDYEIEQKNKSSEEYIKIVSEQHNVLIERDLKIVKINREKDTIQDEQDLCNDEKRRQESYYGERIKKLDSKLDEKRYDISQLEKKITEFENDLYETKEDQENKTQEVKQLNKTIEVKDKLYKKLQETLNKTNFSGGSQKNENMPYIKQISAELDEIYHKVRDMHSVKYEKIENKYKKYKELLDKKGKENSVEIEKIKDKYNKILIATKRECNSKLQLETKIKEKYAKQLERYYLENYKVDSLEKENKMLKNKNEILENEFLNVQNKKLESIGKMYRSTVDKFVGQVERAGVENARLTHSNDDNEQKLANYKTIAHFWKEEFDNQIKLQVELRTEKRKSVYIQLASKLRRRTIEEIKEVIKKFVYTKDYNEMLASGQIK